MELFLPLSVVGGVLRNHWGTPESTLDQSLGGWVGAGGSWHLRRRTLEVKVSANTAVRSVSEGSTR
jgi:hypothetical protein